VVASGVGNAATAQPGAADAAGGAGRRPSRRRPDSSSTGLSAAGTGVFVAALLSGLVLKLSAAEWKTTFVQTARRMKTPVLVIGQVLGLGYLTRYAGTDAVLGLAFTGAGFMYPFFAAYLGWLGVFLTGSDTAIERAVRQPAAHHGTTVASERGADRGDQFDRAA